MADWSKLPYSIIQNVSTQLIAIEDFLAFSAVCSSWRSVYLANQWHPAAQIPVLMFSDFDNSHSRSFFSLYRNMVNYSELTEALGKRCWGSPSGWLVTIGKKLEMHILNPFTRVSVSLPLKSSLQNHTHCNGMGWYGIIDKAYVFRKPCTSNANVEDLVVMIIYGPLKQLAYCRPGYSSWKCFKPTSKFGFIDVACVGDQIFALCDLGKLVAIDIDRIEVIDMNCQRPPINLVSSLPQSDQDHLFLVESSGNLWLVFHDRCRKRGWHSTESEFRVFALDYDNKLWTRLSDLENHTIFVGDGYSASIHGADRLNCKCNSIYFVDKKKDLLLWPYREAYDDIGVYSIADGIYVPLSVGPANPKFCLFALWVTPTLECNTYFAVVKHLSDHHITDT